jgi:hypothetical protein
MRRELGVNVEETNGPCVDFFGLPNLHDYFLTSKSIIAFREQYSYCPFLEVST